MKRDTSWVSLFKCGDATKYFSLRRPNQIQINAGCFNLETAWWLAEVSRLIYHPDFSTDTNIDFGAFNYELLAYIENEETSTHLALLKVIQQSPCVILAFRGSDEIEDWGINARVYQNAFNDGKVHRGFRKAYLSIKEQLLIELDKVRLPLFITGHSLGAALAILATSDLYQNDYFDSCYTFGSPRIGNPDFINSLPIDSIYRVVNNSDIVTTIPIDFTNIIYKHAGEPFLIDEEQCLQKSLDEDSIYDYQKGRIDGLKDYALKKILNNELKTIKEDLPLFLADHAPINYTLGIQKLLKNKLNM